MEMGERASFYRHLKKLANVGPAGKGQQLIPLACFICLTYPSSSSFFSLFSLSLTQHTLSLPLPLLLSSLLFSITTTPASCSHAQLPPITPLSYE